MGNLRDTLRSTACAVLLAFLVGGACSKSTQHGPATGGPAILMGSFDVSTVIPGPVLVRVFWPTDYSRPLGSATISPTDTFTIAGLPADSVDVIVTSPNYFALKACDFLLKDGVNRFERVSVFMGQTYTEQYALSDTSRFDARGREKWVPDMVLVRFKDATMDSLKATAVLHPYDCLVIQRSSLPGWFTVDIPDDRTVPQMGEMLTFDERVHTVCPNSRYYLEPDTG